MRINNSIFIEYLEKLFLLIGQETCYVSVIIIGFIVLNRKIFAESLCVLFFTMILNILLKNIFQIPLNPALNIKGYAFPSGHMIGAAAFYGWVFINIRHYLLKTLIVVMLLGLGSALIYFGYHNLIDVIVAVVFAIAIIILVRILVNQQIFQKHLFLIGIFLWIFSVPIMLYLNYEMKIDYLPWMPFYGLLGFSLSWMLFAEYLNLPQSKLNIILNLTIAILAIIIISYVIHLIAKQLDTKLQLQWFFIGFSLPLSVRICHFVRVKNNVS